MGNLHKSSEADVIPWVLLRSDAEHIYSRVADGWDHLLEDPAVQPREYRNYLTKYAGFFFHSADGLRIVVADMVLHRNLERVDFAVIYDFGGAGLIYELVKVTSPHLAPYGLGSKMTQDLEKAKQQVESWQTWIVENPDRAKRLFPSKSFLVYDEPFFDFTVYMGRCPKNPHWRRETTEHSRFDGIDVRSFDWLCPRYRKDLFTPILGGKLDLIKRNELANPFVKAFTEETWKEMTRHPGFNRYSHMIENNADYFIQGRSVNDLYPEYLSIWTDLADARKREILEAIVQLQSQPTPVCS